MQFGEYPAAKATMGLLNAFIGKIAAHYSPNYV